MAGNPLLLRVNNNDSKRSDIEEYLPKNFQTSYLILPPGQQYGLGYTLYFDNLSKNDSATINDLSEVAVYPLPFLFLSSLRLDAPGNQPKPPSNNTENVLSVAHPLPSVYAVTIDNEPGILKNPYLVLSQSFHQGWHAYIIKTYPGNRVYNFLSQAFPFIFGRKIDQHVLLNNWENGWAVAPGTLLSMQQNSQSIVLVFLSQYWEVLGLAAMISGVAVLLKKY
ncbi:hypothetical protein HY214_04095 [Candidatus Roizmanbacteria bacterium]|nr:hypothetical protein [Candidatus Roizmanbacteria bacterium]